jgi:hypothetical protein
MTKKISLGLERSDESIAKWNQVKQEKIDSVVEQFRKVVELVSLPQTKVGLTGEINTQVGQQILHEFVVERNAILYGFETKEEYRQAIRGISKSQASIPFVGETE